MKFNTEEPSLSEVAERDFKALAFISPIIMNNYYVYVYLGVRCSMLRTGSVESSKSKNEVPQDPFHLAQRPRESRSSCSLVQGD